MPNTREKQIELVEVINDYFGVDAAYFDVDAFTLAKRIMEAGFAKLEWISVKDRLPKPFTPVLVYRKSFGTLPPYIKVDKMTLWNDDTQVWTDEVGNWKNVTTHWMPLPQPPKGE